MKGFPKHLNSRADYDYVRKNFPADEWKPVWQALLDNRMTWAVVGKLDNEAAGVTDATHKVVKVKAEEGRLEEYYQYEYRLDKSSDFVKHGFTVEEIEKALSE